MYFEESEVLYVSFLVVSFLWFNAPLEGGGDGWVVLHSEQVAWFHATSHSNNTSVSKKKTKNQDPLAGAPVTGGGRRLSSLSLAQFQFRPTNKATMAI